MSVFFSSYLSKGKLDGGANAILLAEGLGCEGREGEKGMGDEEEESEKKGRGTTTQKVAA